MAENRRPTDYGSTSSLTSNYNITHEYNHLGHNNNASSREESDFDTEEARSSALRANQNALNDGGVPTTPTKAKAQAKSKKAAERRIDFTKLGHGRTPRAGGKRKSTTKHQAQQEQEEGDEAAHREREAALTLVMETQRLQLISPPPEETLTLQRHWRLSSGGAGTPAPALAKGQSATKTDTSPQTRAKRKRAGVTVPPPPEAMDVDTPAPEQEEQQRVEDVQATPNPKPRKIRHVRAQEDSPIKAMGKGKSRDKDVEDVGSPMNVSPLKSPQKHPSASSRSTTPTKSTKPRHSIVQSPYARNPDADWIPPVSSTALASATVRRAVLGARGSRRSATPIPAYEPPTDVFTPPKEVFLPPRPVEGRRTPRTAKKGSARKPRVSALRVDTVKLELPDDLDLNAPMPPPSPSDDPLLLSGPPEPAQYGWASSPLRGAAQRREARERARPVRIEPVAEEEEEEMDGPLPPSSPESPLNSEDTRAVEAFNFEREADVPETEDSMMYIDPADAEVLPVQLFGPDEGGGGWSDSDDEMNYCVEEGEGEYTGRFRTIRVPTKQDPPSSATRERMDRWGRPISPFPRIKKPDFSQGEVNDVRLSMEPSPPPTSPLSRSPESEKLDFLQEEDPQQDEREEEEVRQLSLEPEPDVNPFDFHSIDDVDNLPDLPEEIQAAATEEVPVEEHAATLEAEDGDDSSSSSSIADDDEVGFVKITSADPRAAARAAAILKQHDYECYTKLLLKKHHRASHSGVEDLVRESRRRDLVTASIRKSAAKNRPRISVIDDQVFIPGTPVTTLPALLQEAEAEVQHEHEHNHTPSKVWAARDLLHGPSPRSLFTTPLPAARPSLLPSSHGKAYDTPMRLPLPVYNAAGERVWTREEWRVLDACFTDQRLDVGEALPGAEEGTLAPVDMIKMEDVVDRFVVLLGGKDVVEKWGEDWERDDLLERARALQNKQRAGRVARPSTPRSPFLFGPQYSYAGNTSTSTVTVNQMNVGNYSSKPKQKATMEVPDFTPLFNRRAAAHPRKAKPVHDTATTLSAEASTTLPREDTVASPCEEPTFAALPSRPVFPPPVTENAPFSRLREEQVDDEDGETPLRTRAEYSMPRSLLAPRYGHLLEEAVRVSREGVFGVPGPDATGDGPDRPAEDEDGQEEERELDEQEQEECNNGFPQTPAPAAPVTAPAPPSTLRNRVKGFLFSYLPTRPTKPFVSAIPTRNTAIPVPTRTARTNKPAPARPGLPLPPSLPPAVLAARARGPVATPARPPVPRAKPLRELVELHHAPLPEPRVGVRPGAREPKRLVQLARVERVEGKEEGKVGMRPRSSAGSVKDLVRGFEELERGAGKGVGVGRPKSVSEVRVRWRAGQPDGRPRWRG